MVPGHDNLDGMREAVEPVELLLDVHRRARIGEVAGVDKDVAVGHLNCRLVVRVRDTDYADGLLVAGWAKWAAAQPDEDVVDVDGEKGERRQKEMVKYGEALPLIGAAQAEGLEKAHTGQLLVAPEM